MPATHHSDALSPVRAANNLPAPLPLPQDKGQSAADTLRRLEAALHRHKETGKWMTWTASASAQPDAAAAQDAAGKSAASKDTGRGGGSGKGSGKTGGKGGARAAASSSKAGDGGREADAERITDVKDWMQEFSLSQDQLESRHHKVTSGAGWLASRDHSMCGLSMDGSDGNPPSLLQVLEGTGASVRWLEHAVSVLAFLSEELDEAPDALERYMEESGWLSLGRSPLTQEEPMASLTDSIGDDGGLRSDEFTAVQQALLCCDPSLQHLSEDEQIQASVSATSQIQLIRGHVLLMRERGLVGADVWPGGSPPLNCHPVSRGGRAEGGEEGRVGAARLRR
jgi:hypothetical protein